MLDRLAPRPGARQKRKRASRGPGSGLGKTAGRGGKGQGKNSRGSETPFYFEGGQMPLVRRLPKRGFTNVHRISYEIINELAANTATTDWQRTMVSLIHGHDRATF